MTIPFAGLLGLVFAAACIGGCPSEPERQAPAAVAASHAMIVELEARFAAASRERLKVLYGDAHRIEVADAGPGLRVEMRLPLEI